ncbi:bifunctional DNA-binding transcriptional regulator/O6-methylguanine-DNA methyltransferase Ada [Arhodomonas sp. AD133]|uniref:bifunctional DNA-binding transcriptional regulator/O6-methylguanine-DNA methyltransferase Ada n=1 Tax=Arhodomonas sp. AD133 TaxID=3415009 RepID=UPI003EB9E625
MRGSEDIERSRGAMSADDLDEHRWHLVLERRGEPGSRFVYAVTTTGVYCRPTCASRKPKRDNVVFFSDAVSAERAGFRPCQRCRPDKASTSAHGAAIEQACRRLESAENEPSLADLAKAAGMSPSHFQRVFKRQLGVSPKAYAQAVRSERIKSILGKGVSVTEAIYEAGFSGPSRAYATALGELGMSPQRWRSGASGEMLRYAVTGCYLGRILVAGTVRGVCAIEFGDTDAELVASLRNRFPNAELAPADDEFTHWLDTLLAFLQAPTGALELPLDIQGTAFQRQVWEALRTIEPGERVTYAELARMVGRPGAARAVARACASNRVAVAVPCHRVVRSDGEIAGYRWGAERKRRLLAREGEQRNP